MTLIFVLFLVFNMGNAQGATMETTTPHGVFSWLAENWQSLALIISEGASLVSAKYSGIIKSVITFITSCVKKK